MRLDSTDLSRWTNNGLDLLVTNELDHRNRRWRAADRVNDGGRCRACSVEGSGVEKAAKQHARTRKQGLESLDLPVNEDMHGSAGGHGSCASWTASGTMSIATAPL